MAKRDALRNGSRTVYTSGVSEVDKAMWSAKAPVDSTVASRGAQLSSISEPLPSQKYAFQRGLARAALKLPEQERLMALAEALAAMGLLERVFPRM
jgi:hypothetical protein